MAAVAERKKWILFFLKKKRFVKLMNQMEIEK